MDEWIKQGHWWWLLVVPVASGAAALLGSWLGAKLGKNTEHWQWLRNEKRKEYIDSVDSMSELVDTLGKLIQRRPAKEIKANTEFITPILVLGSGPVKRAMKSAMEDVYACMAAYDASLSLGDMKPAQDAHDTLAKSYEKYLESVRRDLGIKN